MTDWQVELERSFFTERQKECHRIVIRWFVSFCQKQRPPLAPDRKSANYFYTTMVARHQPKDWQKQQWKEGLGWYLDLVDPKPDPAKARQLAQEDKRPWEELFVEAIRLRHLSYRTEQTYLGWLRRFAQFCQGKDLRQVKAAEVRRFLSDLAVKARVSASTQNQALNALVFLYREVLARPELDLSGSLRAPARSQERVVLTPGEVERVLAALSGTHQLMARLMYGSGIRLMELLRLRVHPVR